MKPVRTAWTEIVYRGPRPDIGDLYCHREQPGEIWSVWEPTPEERELLAAGGRIRLVLCAEPIPPISLDIISAEESQPVSERGFKAIPELDDQERQT